MLGLEQHAPVPRGGAPEHRVAASGEVEEVVLKGMPLGAFPGFPYRQARLSLRPGDAVLLMTDGLEELFNAEREMLVMTTGAREQLAEQGFSAEELLRAQKLVRQMPVGDKIVDAILGIVRRGRPEDSDLPEVRAHVAWGPGPRASQALMLGMRARALLQGRLSPSIDDILEITPAILRHRMALNFAARADGVALDDVISRLMEPYA